MRPHTPGPWRWIEGDIGSSTTDLVGAGDYPVLSIYESHGGGGRPDDPDARLIAAAPDILAACRSVVAQFERIKTLQTELLVTGQSLESAANNWDEATLGQSIDFEPLIAAIAKAEGTP